MYPLNPHSRPITQTSIMVGSRRYVDLLDPRPEDVDLDDLARGLAAPRFRNQTQIPISIADHSLRCARFGLACEEPIEVILALLLHDVAEAYLGDPPGPLKPYMLVTLRNGALVEWTELEALWTDAICHALLPPVMADHTSLLISEKRGPVARYDHMALRVEALLWMPGAEDWAGGSTINTSNGVVAVEPIDPRCLPATILHEEDAPLCWNAAVEMICEPFQTYARDFRDGTRDEQGVRAEVMRTARERARAYLANT